MGSQKQDRAVLWVVKVRYITVPNAKERLSRAVTILLKAGTEKKKDERRQDMEEAR